MDYRHFGLSGAPFQFSPSLKLLFQSKAHRQSLAALEASLEQEPYGISLLIGETGTGKTTLIVSLLTRNHTTLQIAYVNNPKVGVDGLLRDVARQFGIAAPRDRLEFLDALDRYFAELPAPKKAVVIIDEAQALDDEALDDLRLFADRHIDGEKPLHLIFVGQPGLLARLRASGLRQLNERIGTRVQLNPLEAEEAQAYVDYRLAAFGGSSGALFARGALEYLLARSRKIPRRINVLCYNAMLCAYRAGESRISLRSACDAEREVEDLCTDPNLPLLFTAPRIVRRRIRELSATTPGFVPAFFAATLAIAGIGSLYFWNSGSQRANLIGVNRADPVGDAIINYPDANPVSQLALGRGQSPTEGALSPLPVPTDENQLPRVVRVRPGDTLLAIAHDHQGSDDYVARLIRANPQVSNVNHIFPGEILILPAGDAARSGAVLSPATVGPYARIVAPPDSSTNDDGE